MKHVEPRPTLHVTQGLPASGKTTLAAKVIANSSRPVRYVSLDGLRWMLDGQMPKAHWPPGFEESTTRGQAALVGSLLADGMDVLVDNTHVTAAQCQALREVLDGWRLEVVVHTVRTPLAECLARDARRDYPIGEECIRRLAREWAAATAAGWVLSGEWLTSLAEPPPMPLAAA